MVILDDLKMIEWEQIIDANLDIPLPFHLPRMKDDSPYGTPKPSIRTFR